MITPARFFGNGLWNAALAADWIVHPRLARIYTALTTTAGLFFLLPDAQKLKLGGPQIILVNALSSTQSIGVKDGSGASIATVAPGEAREFYLYANSSAAGGWANRDL